jgi:hypothetical protein
VTAADTDEAARWQTALLAALRKLAHEVDAAPGPRERMTAALEYLSILVDIAPDAALSAPPPLAEAAPGPLSLADGFHAGVMSLATAVVQASDFQLCAHDCAALCAEPDCYALPWVDPADPARVIPLEHRHCPSCGGVQGGAGPWTL